MDIGFHSLNFLIGVIAVSGIAFLVSSSIQQRRRENSNEKYGQPVVTDLVQKFIEMRAGLRERIGEFRVGSNEYGYRFFPLFIPKFRIDESGIQTGQRSILWSEITAVFVRERVISARGSETLDCRITIVYSGGSLRFNGSIVDRDDSWWRGFVEGFSGVTPAYFFLKTEIARKVSVPFTEEHASEIGPLIFIGAALTCVIAIIWLKYS